MPQPENKDAPDPERLRRLEERLAKANAPKPPSAAAMNFSNANVAWRMVIELVTGLGIGFGIGYGLDRLLGTMPIFLVLFLLAGLVAGVKVMLRTAQELGRSMPTGETDNDQAAPSAERKGD